MREEQYILLTLVTGAMATDLKQGKIYNYWLLPAFLAGLLWRLVGTGPPMLPTANPSALSAVGPSILSAAGTIALPASGLPVLPAVGLSGFFAALTAAGLTVLLLWPFYAMGGLGAGDIKLLAVIAVFLSPDALLRVVTVSFLLGALMGLPLLLQGKSLKTHIHFAAPVGVGVILHLGGFF